MRIVRFKNQKIRGHVDVLQNHFDTLNMKNTAKFCAKLTKTRWSRVVLRSKDLLRLSLG